MSNPTPNKKTDSRQKVLTIVGTVLCIILLPMLIINGTTVDRVSPAYATFIVLIVVFLAGCFAANQVYAGSLG